MNNLNWTIGHDCMPPTFPVPMPITPHFQLSQTETYLRIDVRVPHIRVSAESVQVLVESDTISSTVHFASPPYLLLLTFPGLLEGDGSESAKYDPLREGGMVTMEMKKVNTEIWADLDLTGQLVKTRQPTTRRPPRISVVADEAYGAEGEEEESNSNGISKPSASEPSLLDISCPRYGFLNNFSGIFRDLSRDGMASEMLQLPQPDETDEALRRTMRLEKEDITFEEDRYLGDLDIEDDYVYQIALAMNPHWKHQSSDETVDSLTNQFSTLTTEGTPSQFFNQDETIQLTSIPYPILPKTTADQDKILLLGLLDILFAYVYDHLMTDGDPTTESSWTLSTLSSCLSWLDSFGANDTIATVVCSSTRRSLIYPYLRNFSFSLRCWDHVALIVESGRRCILRCLLQTRMILDRSENHYLNNRLFVDPYLCWIQRQLTDDVIQNLSKELNASKSQGWISKNALSLRLEELEAMLDCEASSDEESSSGVSEEDGTGGDESDSESEDSVSQNEQKTDETHKKTSSALLDSELGTKLDMLTLSDRLDSDIAAESCHAGKPLIREV